jgi:predicted ester cyclase
MSELENIKAATFFFEAWNTGDLSKVSEYVAADFKAEGPGAPGPMNFEQNMQYNQSFLTAFPGSKFEVLQTIVQSDYVVINWKAGPAVNSGPLRAPSGNTIPPTGKTATIVGSTTSQIKNGKITRSWTFWDMASLLGQLGLLPPM